jgi:hypothetical protein
VVRIVKSVSGTFGDPLRLGLFQRFKGGAGLFRTSSVAFICVLAAFVRRVGGAFAIQRNSVIASSDCFIYSVSASGGEFSAELVGFADRTSHCAHFKRL